MSGSAAIAANSAIGVSLVDGDATVRHARQILLRSEDYDVRSYSTCSALLADPRSRDFACIVLDTERDDHDAGELLREMRATGWRGHAILLEGQTSAGEYAREAEKHGDRVMARTVGDGALIAAISALGGRVWSGWAAR